MIKVLHINSTIYINSGVMSVIMNYYKNINRDKIQFDFLYFKKIPNNSFTYEKDIRSIGGKTFECVNLNNLHFFNKELDRILKENKYDIVHIHDAFILKFIFKTIRKYKNIKIIIHSHATKWSDKKINSLRNWLLCLRNYKYADYLFACSEAAGRFMFKDRDFYILNNAIDVCKFSYNADKRRQIRNKLKIDNKTVIGHVGNFNKQKNHEFIINVFEKVMFEKSDAILLLIGEGTLKSNIEKIVQEKKLNSNVLFVGKKENVQDYYSAMDVFILPSLYEGLPMVGVEAQCSGLPAIFSANITREVELTNCKFLDLKQGSEGWKNEILHTKLVPEEIRKKAANLVTKKNFDIKNESNKLMEVYERIVNS